MKTDITLPENLVINRIHSAKVAMLVTIIVVCIMMIFTTQMAEFDSASIIPPIVVSATVASIIAAFIIAMSLKRKVYAPTESPLKGMELYFTESKSEAVRKAVSDNRWSTLRELTTSTSSGNTMKLEIVYSEDMTFAAYQFFSYVPHTYESCSQIFYIDKEDIKRVNLSSLNS